MEDKILNWSNIYDDSLVKQVGKFSNSLKTKKRKIFMGICESLKKLF